MKTKRIVLPEKWCHAPFELDILGCQFCDPDWHFCELFKRSMMKHDFFSKDTAEHELALQEMMNLSDNGILRPDWCRETKVIIEEGK